MNPFESAMNDSFLNTLRSGATAVEVKGPKLTQQEADALWAHAVKKEADEVARQMAAKALEDINRVTPEPERIIPLSEQVSQVVLPQNPIVQQTIDMTTLAPALPSIKIMTTGGQMPTQATAGSAGWDLYAAEDAVVIPGHKPFPVSCGFKVSMPRDIVMLVCSRSGMSIKGVIVANAPGVVDSDYRGDVKVILVGTPGLKDPFEIKKGDRIAQAVFQWVPAVPIEQVTELDTTVRGEGGLGSSGK